MTVLGAWLALAEAVEGEVAGDEGDAGAAEVEAVDADRPPRPQNSTAATSVAAKTAPATSAFRSMSSDRRPCDLHQRGGRRG